MEASSLPFYLGPRDQAIRTPRAFFAALHLEYRFTLDGASSDQNALLPKHSTKEAQLPWDGERVFCNPPWANVGPFLELAPTADLAVFLVPARVNSRWFHRALALGGRPRFFLKRVRFTPNPGKRANDSGFDCLLLVFRNRPLTDLDGMDREARRHNPRAATVLALTRELRATRGVVEAAKAYVNGNSYDESELRAALSYQEISQ